MVLVVSNMIHLSLSLSHTHTHTHTHTYLSCTNQSATLSQIRILDVTPYSTAITVQWTLKSSEYKVQSPLSITILEIQMNSDGQQLQLNYSIDDIVDESQCLGQLKPSTVYKVCLHPKYTNGITEVEPVCRDVTTLAAMDPSDPNNVDVSSCSEPLSMQLVGTTVDQGKEEVVLLVGSYW